MNLKRVSFATLAAVLAASVYGEEAAAAPQENAALEAEIAYVEALVNYGYPDFAGPIIAATKKAWPESEARFFAIEIRGMLALGKFEEAEKKIAALPDRKGTKYWAARLEMANNYFGRGQKPECMKIYDEFFKVFQKPPADIRKFYTEACYAYGQLLVGDRQYAKAAQRYEQLLAQVADEGQWCNLACETVDIYLRLAVDLAKDPKRKPELTKNLAAADRLVGKLLWKNETQPLYFGRAVSMKAHVEQLRGDMAKASSIIDEYKDMLEEIHRQILQADPDGKFGLLKQSPLPECLYLQAKMLWDAAQAAYKAPKRDDEKIKTYMFGPKKKEGGKRDVSKGAFAMATGVFLNYEVSTWAPAAGDLSQTIKAFAEEKYGAKIKTKITDEQIAKVRAAQFRDAAEKHMAGQYLEAIEAYLKVLAKFPEAPESITAIENVASDYLDLILETKDERLKAEYRINADAVEGYLAERFAEAKVRLMMAEAGNAVIRLAAKEAEYKNVASADRLYTEFLLNYRSHTQSSTIAAQKASEFQKAERYDDAAKYWRIISECYTNSAQYALSLAQLSRCSGKLGDKASELAYISRYIAIETVKIRKLQARFQLAQLYQKDGLAILSSAETNATPEAVEQAENRGTAQIVRAVREFTGFAKEAGDALADKSTNKEDLEKYRDLKEKAMFMLGECWSRMNRPAKNLPKYRERAAKCYEAYLAEYPAGQYSKVGYVKLGTIYTALGDMEKSKSALDRLTQRYPDSDEAKNAKPRLAKNLIEMGMRKEGAEVYAEMLRTDGAYTARQFVSAGEALIEAKSWDLSNQAFEKAIRLAGTASNALWTVAKARLGIAKCAWKQNSLAEARDALDRFLQDAKMSKISLAADANFMLVEVASEQGRTEKDATMRGKYFGAAIGALKKVRVYWKKKPLWEQDVLNLMSGDVLVNRMRAEEAMDLKEEALETCGRAASTFQVFIQSHGVSEARPLDKMQPEEVANLERAYATIVPLFTKMGADQADRVLKFGQEYLDLFPNGKARTEISNCMNQAKADLPNKAAAPAAPASAE